MFSTTAAMLEAQAGLLSNVLGNQHMRYIPKKRLKFDHLGGEGPMTLLYEADAKSGAKWRPHTWKATLAGTLPCYYYASLTLSAQYWQVYPLMFLPSLYYYYDGKKASKEIVDMVEKMWLLKNGDQVVVKTFDGVLHKVDIVHIDEHVVQEKKNKELVFVMTSFGRSFSMSNKNAQYIDYDLVDRVIHAVPVDTVKHQSLYHHLIYK